MLYLASQSPRRSELLTQIQVLHQVIKVDADESVHPGELAADYVRRVTLAKLTAGHTATSGQLVLAADTAVVLDDQILGKPGNRNDAIDMLLALSGKCHRVLTGVAVMNNSYQYKLSISKVQFRDITVAQAQAYWSTGEPADKAGSYGIQGIGALFVESIHGSYSGIMGLPLFETSQLLQPYNLATLSDYL